MKKIMLMMIFVVSLFSCTQKQPIKVRIDTSSEMGNPNVYISNVELKNDKNESVFIPNRYFFDSEVIETSNDSINIDEGIYTLNWKSFNKNGLGTRLNILEHSEKITIDKENNVFGIVGDKLLLKNDYIIHIKSVAELDSIINKIETDSIYIRKSEDEMEGKISYYVSRHLIINDAIQINGKEKFLSSDNADIYPFIKMSNNVLCQDGLCVTLDIKGVSCTDDMSMIIMFLDKTKITLYSYAGFDCEGRGFFSLTPLQIKELSSKEIEKIRVKDGRSYSELTVDLSKNKDYFIQVFDAINNLKIK
jgi:hypothetical protein